MSTTTDNLSNVIIRDHIKMMDTNTKRITLRFVYPSSIPYIEKLTDSQLSLMLQALEIVDAKLGDEHA